jgi:hypothetical protein
MAYRHPLAFLLGLEGAALLRALVDDDFDGRFIKARIAETRGLLDRAPPELGEGIELAEFSAQDGYRAWSAYTGTPAAIIWHFQRTEGPAERPALPA